MNMYVERGSRIRAQWWEARQVGLAGMGFKAGVEPITLEGKVLKIRGDHPTNPKTVGLLVEDDAGSTSWIDLRHVKEVL